MKTFRIKITSPTSFFWVTKKASSESLAKAMALGQYAGRYGWAVSECVEEKKEA